MYRIVFLYFSQNRLVFWSNRVDFFREKTISGKKNGSLRLFFGSGSGKARGGVTRCSFQEKNGLAYCNSGTSKGRNEMKTGNNHVFH